MNFIRTIFSICSGTKVFTELITVSPWKAIMHYCMFAFICAGLITAFNVPSYSEKATEVSLLLAKVFGAVNISKDGILPETDAAQSRSVDLGNKISLDYVAADSLETSDLFSDKDGEDKDDFRGIAWTPGAVFAWLKIKDGQILVMPFIAEKDKRDVEILNEAEAKNWLAKANKPPYNEFNLPFHKISFQSFTGHAVLGASVMTFGGYLVHIIFSAFLFSGVFSIIYSLISDENIPGLTIKKLFVAALYAGIPGTIIGSAFPAFNLAYFSYQSVYLACLLIYLIAVLNALKRASAPPPEEDDGQDIF